MRMTVLVATAALALCTTPLLAAPGTFTEHFDALDDDLAGRVEGLAGDLDKSEKKQLKRIERARSAMEKESDSLEKDIKVAGKVYKLLKKPFADEIGSGGGLADHLADLGADLRADVREIVDGLPGTGSAGASKSSPEEKAAKLADKADGLLDASADAADFGKAMKLLKKALKQARKGVRVLEKAGGNGPSDGSYAASINSTPFDSMNATVEYTQSNGELQVFGTMPGQFFTITLWFAVEGVTAPGTYSFTAENSSGAYSNGTTDFPLLAGSGSVTVTTLDLDGTPRVAGTFSFQTGNQSITIDVTDGSFDLTDVDIR